MNSKKVGLLRLVLRWAVDFWTVVSLLFFYVTMVRH